MNIFTSQYVFVITLLPCFCGSEWKYIRNSFSRSEVRSKMHKYSLRISIKAVAALITIYIILYQIFSSSLGIISCLASRENIQDFVSFSSGILHSVWRDFIFILQLLFSKLNHTYSICFLAYL